MLKINFDLIDGCEWKRERNIIMYFENMDAFYEYEKSQNNAFYECYINSIEKIEE